MTETTVKAINVSLPIDLLAKVDLLLLDAFRGKPRYGKRSELITKLLEQWLATQTQQKEPPHA